MLYFSVFITLFSSNFIYCAFAKNSRRRVFYNEIKTFWGLGIQQDFLEPKSIVVQNAIADVNYRT